MYCAPFQVERPLVIALLPSWTWSGRNWAPSARIHTNRMLLRRIQLLPSNIKTSITFLLVWCTISATWLALPWKLNQGAHLFNNKSLTVSLICCSSSLDFSPTSLRCPGNQFQLVVNKISMKVWKEIVLRCCVRAQWWQTRGRDLWLYAMGAHVRIEIDTPAAWCVVVSTYSPMCAFY